MRTAVLRAAAGTMLVGATLAATPADAQLNQLEIKEPKVEAGEVEIEYLGDYHFRGPRRRFIEPSPGAFVLDDNELARQRHSFELRYGLTRWLGLRVSLEGEQER